MKLWIGSFLSLYSEFLWTSACSPRFCFHIDCEQKCPVLTQGEVPNRQKIKKIMGKPKRRRKKTQKALTKTCSNDRTGASMCLQFISQENCP